jgi:hypothetical protein
VVTDIGEDAVRPDQKRAALTALQLVECLMTCPGSSAGPATICPLSSPAALPG